MGKVINLEGIRLENALAKQGIIVDKDKFDLNDNDDVELLKSIYVVFGGLKLDL